MILLDTGPIVAFFDRDDEYHALCLETLKKVQEPLLTTWPVITECFYLLDFSLKVKEDLWLFIERGGLEIFPLEKEHYPLCRDLMRRYKDLPMDLADATLVVLAEALGISRVFTLDRRDFFIYRFKRTRRFTLIPPKLR
jgi:predicted nucleic acid-binding protein